MFSGWVFSYQGTPSAQQHVRHLGVRAGERAGEVELTPIGVELNSGRRLTYVAPLPWVEREGQRAHAGVPARGLLKKKNKGRLFFSRGYFS